MPSRHAELVNASIDLLVVEDGPAAHSYVPADRLGADFGEKKRNQDHRLSGSRTVLTARAPGRPPSAGE
jgi:hypothetical protein